MTFSAMIDTLFADAIMAQDATYTPPAGSAAECRVIVKRPDQRFELMDRSVISPTIELDVRVSEVAAPVAGGIFAVGDAEYTVQGKPRRDVNRLVWTCEAVEN